MTLKIIAHDEQNPEDNAMLQALYSRSAETVENHVEKVRKAGSGKFMEQYYLGYGHKSIADCGNTTVYLEGVSMLCAKAFQDNSLFNGQECSSRYIDWGNQPFYDPFNTPQSIALLAHYRKFYVESKPILVEHLKSQNPFVEGDNPSVYEKAINARAFDILRGYLPGGATTNTSVYMSLRKMGEMVEYLHRHPLEEVGRVAVRVHGTLRAKFPNSIGELPKASDADDYLYDPRHYYSDPDRYMEPYYPIAPWSALQTEITDLEPDVQFTDLSFYNKRPKYGTLPKHDELLQKNLLISTFLDFGSYRDLQRHRNGYCALPMVSNIRGFHPFYYEALPTSLKANALKLFAAIEIFMKQLWTGADKNNFDTKLKLQYLMPLGTLVPTSLTYNIHQALYVAEIRSGQTVHPTLRPIAQEIGHYLSEDLGINTYCDFGPDTWSIKRGKQDITQVDKSQSKPSKLV